jgi:hypothetical protein
MSHVNLLRLVFALTLVFSQIGVALCDFVKGDWKTGLIALLFCAANILIFFVK